MHRTDRRMTFFVLAIALALAGATPAMAQGNPLQTRTGQTPVDEILITLRDKGYLIVENKRTWLGRQRIIAEKDGARREVVFNPGTGEILRDYAFKIAPADATRMSREAAKSGVGMRAGVAAGASSVLSLSVGESLDIGRTEDLGVAAGDSPE
jgi:hypothetical protein